MENYSHIRFVSSEVPVNEFKLMLKPNNPKLMPDQTLSGPSKFNKIHEKIDDELGNSPLGAIHNAPTTFPSGMTADLNLMENKVHFANGLMQYIGKIVLEYSKAIYGVLTHNTNLEPPSRLSIVAAGDGGPTEGLFGGLNNEAVLFFNYDAIFDGTDPSKFMKANSTKSVDNISLINKNRTIHMAIFGLDEDSVDTKVFIEFIAGSTTYEIEFSANKASPILIPQSTSSISVTSSLSPSGTTVYTCTAGSLTLGFYDLDMQNFTFPDSVATNTCNVRMESANFGPGNFEESCLILNVFEDTPIIPPVFNITLQNNFRPDEFELSLNQKANNFPALASEQLQLR